MTCARGRSGHLNIGLNERPQSENLVDVLRLACLKGYSTMGMSGVAWAREQGSEMVYDEQWEGGQGNMLESTSRSVLSCVVQTPDLRMS